MKNTAAEIKPIYTCITVAPRSHRQDQSPIIIGAKLSLP